MTQDMIERASKYLVYVFMLIFLFGCDARDPPKQESKWEQVQVQVQETKLLANPATAIPELLRRLRAAVSMRDGLIVIQSPLSLLQTAILPASTPWVVVCGVGISVHFGSAVAEHDGSVAVADVLNVPLVFGVIVPKETCAELGPAVGKEIQTIIGAK
jgi:hypothetical protein